MLIQIQRKLRVMALCLGLLAVGGVTLAHTNTAQAQDLDAGIEAYERGDYATALRIFEFLGRPRDETPGNRITPGNDVAQYYMGVMYYYGEGVVQNYTESAKWYRKAANQGYADAQYNLGVMHENGDGVLQNPETAAELYFRAAVQDHTQARINLGYAYANGRGTLQSNVAAHIWYNIASKSGNQQARQAREEVQNRLSSDELAYARNQAQRCLDTNYENCLLANPLRINEAFEHGEEAYNSGNYATALGQLRPIAELGHAEAQYYLGEMYYWGRSVGRNYVEAVKWYRRAAPQGDVESQYSLGWVYEHGEGVEQNEGVAIEWYSRAAAQGHESAQEQLRELQ